MFTLTEVSTAIKASLSPDLLQSRYRRQAEGHNKYFGHCYAASEALYHMQGGASSGYVPQVVRHKGGTHWYLKHRDTGKIVDLTKRQFATPVPYDAGKGCGFLTRQPSKRAQTIIERAQRKLTEKQRRS